MSELPGAGKVQFIIPYILGFFLQNGVGVWVQDYLIDSRVTHLTLVTSLIPGSYASTNTYLVEQRAKCFLSVLWSYFDHHGHVGKILGSSHVHTMLTPTEHIHVYGTLWTLWQWPQSTKSMDLIGYSNILPW